MLIEVQPKDMGNVCIYVKYDPLGSCRRMKVVKGMVDISSLQDTKYGKYITGISPRENDDTYDLVLTPEGRDLWEGEKVSISNWMAKWGCD